MKIQLYEKKKISHILDKKSNLLSSSFPEQSNENVNII